MSAPVPAAHGQFQIKETGGQPLTFGAVPINSYLKRDSANQLTGETGLSDFSPSNTSPSVGSGSPEGGVTRSPGASYFDTVTNLHYYKKTGTGNTGWQLVT